MTSTIISLILCELCASEDHSRLTFSVIFVCAASCSRQGPTNPIESLPQETIDAIIDNLPRYSLPSSSLVARQWRTRSQQRILASITFRSQCEVGRWHSDVQGGQNKILSYVRSVQFRCINSWNDPALPGRVLKGFPSLTTLEVYGTVIPDELLDQTSRGEFGRTINNLQIRFPRCALSAIISMILSFPELKELTVSLEKTALEQPVSTSSVTQKRGSLDWLGLWGHTGGISEALIQLQFTSRHLCLGSNNSNAHRLLALSSETLVGLWLEGVWILWVSNCRSVDNDLCRPRLHQDTYSRPYRSTAISCSHFS